MVGESEATAYHEAGHAVAGALLGYPTEYLTIIPADGLRGLCVPQGKKLVLDLLWEEAPSASPGTRAAEAGLALSWMAGPATQRQRTGGSWVQAWREGGSFDFERCLEWAPSRRAGEPARLDCATAAADWFASYFWPEIHALAEVLFHRREMDAEDVRRAVGPLDAQHGELVAAKLASVWGF